MAYQNDPQKVLTGECRLSYAHLDQPYAKNQGDEPRYQVTLLIPKSDTATVNDIMTSIEAAAQEATGKTWGGTRPEKIPGSVYVGETPCTLYDGDGFKPKGGRWGDECHGFYVLRASSKQKPHVVGIDNVNVDLAPSDVYSGMWGRVTVRFYGYNNKNGKAIGCGLGNVLKTRDDEPFSGQTDAATDFAGITATPQPRINPLTGQPM